MPLEPLLEIVLDYRFHNFHLYDNTIGVIVQDAVTFFGRIVSARASDGSRSGVHTKGDVGGDLVPSSPEFVPSNKGSRVYLRGRKIARPRYQPIV
jgi:hypothetical protein